MITLVTQLADGRCHYTDRHGGRFPGRRATPDSRPGCESQFRGTAGLQPQGDRMTTPNAELAYEALDAATAHPAHFSMGTWTNADEDEMVGIEELTSPDPHCGTTACFAGWAAALRGYRVGGEDGISVFRGDKLVHDFIQEFAADLLGISDETAERLFYVDDDEISDAVAEIFGPRPERAP